MSDPNENSCPADGNLTLSPALDLDLSEKHEAFSFQLDAFNAIRDLEYAAVFHEQGLGKTKIAIDLTLYWLSQKTLDSVLIVTKKTLIANWERELGVHAHVKPRIFDQNRKSNFFAFNSPSRIYLTHYEVLKSELGRMALFLKTRRVGVILDESQKIKNPDSALSKAAHEIAPLFPRRVILTGTPIANRPFDIWSQVFFLDLGKSLGQDFSSFQMRLDLDSDLGSSETLQTKFEDCLVEIQEEIAVFSVRETKQGANISLPDKVIENVGTEWEGVQYELYASVRDELRANVIKNGLPTEDKSESILKRLLRLVQVASNPLLVDESYAGVPGKLPVLMDLISHITGNEEKAIIWSSFTSNVDWLAQILSEFGSVKVHGKMAIGDRNRGIEHFLTNEKRRVLIATPGAAKEGLTLTAANHVIFYDRSFSLDDYLQAQDRIHRISQTRKCFVTNLLMEDSIDEWVDVLLKAKELAAQLGQGDITLEEYRSLADYSFPYVLRKILGIEELEQISEGKDK